MLPPVWSQVWEQIYRGSQSLDLLRFFYSAWDCGTFSARGAAPGTVWVIFFSLQTNSTPCACARRHWALWRVTLQRGALPAVLTPSSPGGPTTAFVRAGYPVGLQPTTSGCATYVVSRQLDFSSAFAGTSPALLHACSPDSGAGWICNGLCAWFLFQGATVITELHFSSSSPVLHSQNHRITGWKRPLRSLSPTINCSIIPLYYKYTFSFFFFSFELVHWEVLHL